VVPADEVTEERAERTEITEGTAYHRGTEKRRATEKTHGRLFQDDSCSHHEAGRDVLKTLLWSCGVAWGRVVVPSEVL
jgi:hypothetical protein